MGNEHLKKDQPKPPRSDAGAAGVTPMMAQYLEIKAANPDCLLFYQMGDFYELFFEDAEEASRALGIELTKRGKHLGQDIAMCGVPLRRADDYLQKLIRAGYRVAVCEQTEDPAQARKRGPKSIVRRDVMRLITPGTITEDTLLDARANNYLSALFRAPTSTTEPVETFAIASLDISTGEFLINSVAGCDLEGELARLAPGEIIASDELADEVRITLAVTHCGAALTSVPRSSFDSLTGERLMKQQLGLATLDGLGRFARSEMAAVGALLSYVELTQIGSRTAIRPPITQNERAILLIDAATRINLELVKTQQGNRQGSLLSVIDRTVSGAGARTLATRLASPLTDRKAIASRLDAAGWCLEHQAARAALRKTLRGSPDLARALARITVRRGGPRDIAAIRDALTVASQCGALIAGASDNGLPGEIEHIRKIAAPGEAILRADLEKALGDELPLYKRDGGFIRDGYLDDLDEVKVLRDNARRVIAELQADYAKETGIKSLKIRHNNVLGYFVEVSAANGGAMMQTPLNETFIHRQTLANAVRFTTTQLGETESRIVSAADRALSLELEVFGQLEEKVDASASRLGDIAASLGELDHYCALGELAEEQNYARPAIDGSTAFEVQGGRHPVVEQALAKGEGAAFVENDCHLVTGEEGLRHEEGTREENAQEEHAQSGRVWVVTGPNMAGKSTFLRQNALIVILAQMGSYVPARFARIGTVDRVFSRVGASDDLAGGRSTFMVEMVETAGILNQAGERSFVILDEIGRGTATFDGLSIAWACVEHLHEVNRSRALFATHYHELTSLANALPHAANVTMDVKEWNDEIIFLHKVVAGGADRSYGIHVAKLAGLPESAVARARDVLHRLEGGERASPAHDLANDLPLFAAAPAHASRSASPGPSEVEIELGETNPDEMTPRDALELVYRLKALFVQKQADK